MYTTNQEEMDIIENIARKPNNAAEKIKEAIIEMNIMREERISIDALIKLIE